AGTVDAVTFTSSSTARNFAEMFSEAERQGWRGHVAVAAIGPITAATAAEYGLATDIMPAEYTIPALARAIVEWFAQIPKRPGRRGRRSERWPTASCPRGGRARTRSCGCSCETRVTSATPS